MTTRDTTITQRLLDLESSTPAVVTRAIRFLAKLGGDAVPQLAECIDKASEIGRCRIAMLLGASGAGEAYEALVRLTMDAAETVQYDSIVALGKLHDERAVSLLSDIVNSPGHTVLKDVAIESLAKFGDAALPELALVLKSGAEDDRSLAAWCLGRIGTSRAVNQVMSLTHDPSLRVRIAAIEGLSSVDPDLACRAYEAFSSDNVVEVSKTLEYWKGEMGCPGPPS